MLPEINEPAQALEQFEATLKKEPGRFRALHGAARAAQLSGNRDASQRYSRELLKVCVHADKPGRSEVAEADSQTALKPIIENDRVVVWDVTDSDGPNSAAFIDGTGDRPTQSDAFLVTN
jgi:hypothetical protein